MSLRKIALMGNPTLATRAAEISDPSAPSIRLLAADMVETMLDADGVGLAAPQVHVPMRLIVFQAPAEEGGAVENDPAVAPLTVLINPEIEVLGPETEGAWEGCLSLPGLRGFVVRPAHIRYRGLDLEGKPIDREAKGLHARVVQHETDHLDGVLYPQRIRDLRQFIFESEAKHWAAKS